LFFTKQWKGFLCLDFFFAQIFFVRKLSIPFVPQLILEIAMKKHTTRVYSLFQRLAVVSSLLLAFVLFLLRASSLLLGMIVI
jgi:hypothetical protein